ncbi:ATP-grasp domain-containing protein [Simplicispira hankyongi]|uniref:ATP-grasp domain-containing protein n=2 Tax=Simplicispira hankyongi TaxID=2315688 RepID=A0A398CA40_9BURK|nr:ATP-grasp domain-containing protein [Simplicispira hankyongi]
MLLALMQQAQAAINKNKSTRTNLYAKAKLVCRLWRQRLVRASVPACRFNIQRVMTCHQEKNSGQNVLLVSGVGKRNALIRIIKGEAENHRFDMVGADASDYCPARVEFENFSIIPAATQQNFSDDYLKLVNANNVTAFLTLIDVEIAPLARLQLPSSICFLHPGIETALICEDKYFLSIAAQENNVNIVETRLLPLDTFPCIRKDRRGSAASGFQIYQNPEELRNAGNMDGDFVYQPFCFGVHYCIDAYFSIYDSRLIDLCVKRVLGKSKGESFVLQSEDSTRFVDFVESLSPWLNLRGIVNFDVYEEDGIFKLMDVNCRIGGNYPASHVFGCNLLKHLFAELTGGIPVQPLFTKYKSGMLVSKYFEFTAPIAFYDRK